MPTSAAAPGSAPIGRLLTGAGVTAVLGGAAGWLTVRSQLSRERIVVPRSAAFFAGRQVKGPVGAFAQAEAIRAITLEATGGRTYSELGENEPVAQVAMNSSLLRSSLYTSVLAFGVSGSLIGLGGTLIAIGSAVSRLSRHIPA